MFLHLCVILFTGGVSVPACTAGHITRRGLCPGGFCPGAVCPRGSLSIGDICAGDSVQGVSVRGSVRETPPYGNERAVTSYWKSFFLTTSNQPSQSFPNFWKIYPKNQNFPSHRVPLEFRSFCHSMCLSSMALMCSFPWNFSKFVEFVVDSFFLLLYWNCLFKLHFLWCLNSKFLHVQVKNVENSAKRAHPCVW